MKGPLREAASKSFGWTKGPAGHENTWQSNDDVCNSVGEKLKLWKKWKQGNACQKYLKAKKEATRDVCNAKGKAERKRFGSVMRRNDRKSGVFKVTRKMVKTSEDVIGEH